MTKEEQKEYQRRWREAHPGYYGKYYRKKQEKTKCRLFIKFYKKFIKFYKIPPFTS